MLAFKRGCNHTFHPRRNTHGKVKGCIHHTMHASLTRECACLSRMDENCTCYQCTAEVTAPPPASFHGLNFCDTVQSIVVTFLCRTHALCVCCVGDPDSTKTQSRNLGRVASATTVTGPIPLCVAFLVWSSTQFRHASDAYTDTHNQNTQWGRALPPTICVRPITSCVRRVEPRPLKSSRLC